MSLRAQHLKHPRTYWKDRAAERRRRLKRQLCEAWTTPWTAGSYWAKSEPCSARAALVINGTLRLCLKHARIEALSLLLRGKPVKLTYVKPRLRDLTAGVNLRGDES